MTDLALKLTPMPTSVWVACSESDCTAFGIQRQIWLKQVAVGVVDVPRLVCVACRSELVLPLFQDVEEAEVPKIHVGREPTDRADIPAPTAAVAAEPAEVEPVADAASAETEAAAEAPAAAKKATPRKGARAKAGGEG
jgi:hypothetical protein